MKAGAFILGAFFSVAEVDNPEMGFRSVEEDDTPELLVEGPEVSEIRAALVALLLTSVASSVEGFDHERLLSMLIPAGLPTSPTLLAIVPSSEILPESDIVSSKGRISSTDVSSCSS